MSDRKAFRIGVDASMLCSPLTGIGRYTKEILRRVVRSPHQWFVYSHRPLDPQLIGQYDNVVFRYSNMPKRFMRLIWSQVILPIQVANDNIDLLWSPAHRSPLFFPGETANVVSIHDLVWRYAPQTMQFSTRLLDYLLMPAAIRRADKIIAVSNHTADDISKMIPIAINKTIVTHLGANIEVSESHSEDNFLDINLNYPYMLFVGTLEPRKNLRRLLISYSLLPSRLKEKARLVIAGGPGWGDVPLRQLISELNLTDFVRVLGYVSDQALGVLYKNALFLVMPSIYEGFGLPIVEAISRGCPVLTSDCSSMPEVARSAGLYVDPFDIASINRGLRAMVEDEDLRAKLIHNCPSVAKNFDWDCTSEMTLQVFVNVIEHRRSIVNR